MIKKVLILGGNRFFGKHLALSLLQSGHQVTLLNRGQADDGLGSQVERLKADRQKASELANALRGKNWDVVFDQICYTANEAKKICELLQGQTQNLIFTSSQSVYDSGALLTEDTFNPAAYEFSKEVTPTEDYSEAKRQCETVFARHPELHPVMVRFPLVVGRDDYTGRLAWHVQRCANGLPIYFPNVNAKLSFIRSDRAGKALHQIMDSSIEGPVNCACPGDIRLSDLMTLMRKRQVGLT